MDLLPIELITIIHKYLFNDVMNELKNVYGSSLMLNIIRNELPVRMKWEKNDVYWRKYMPVSDYSYQMCYPEWMRSIFWKDIRSYDLSELEE